MKIGEVHLGTTTRLIVPLVGKNQAELLREAKLAQQSAADLVEWRLDHLATVLELAQTVAIGRQLRSHCSKPLIATFRTLPEGGEQAISAEDYLALYRGLLDEGLCEALDLEGHWPDEVKSTLRKLAHQHEVPIICSAHYFQETPAITVLQETLRTLAASGDIGKLAVMPKTPQDVLDLLTATLTVSAETKQPLITMAMGDLGMISRIAGANFGSVATFGSLAAASAPGQIPIETLATLIK